MAPFGQGPESTKQGDRRHPRSLRCRPSSLFRPPLPPPRGSPDSRSASFLPGDTPHACRHAAGVAPTHPRPPSTRPPFTANRSGCARPAAHHPRSARAMASTTSRLRPGAPLRPLRALADPRTPESAAVLLCPPPRSPAPGGGPHSHRPARTAPQRTGPAHPHLAALAAAGRASPAARPPYRPGRLPAGPGAPRRLADGRGGGPRLARRVSGLLAAHDRRVLGGHPGDRAFPPCTTGPRSPPARLKRRCAAPSSAGAGPRRCGWTTATRGATAATCRRP
jgi:hypothetical protein